MITVTAVIIIFTEEAPSVDLVKSEDLQRFKQIREKIDEDENR